MATRTTSDWPRYCGAGAVPRPRVDWLTHGRWGYGDGVRPFVLTIARQQGVAQHCLLGQSGPAAPPAAAVLRQSRLRRLRIESPAHEVAVKQFLPYKP